MKQKLLSFFLLCILLIGAAYAQDRRIRGKVTNEVGESLPGVSVIVAGTTTGTQTDSDGNYAITVPPTDAKLIFSYIGYASQNLEVGQRSIINVTLSSQDNSLDEVVVVAYGTAKKEAITGSVATMNSADISKRTVTNITNAIAGMAPGVNVNSGNGQPGTGSNIRIRGFGSISASNAPLYVVDGAVFDGDIGDINPNDIENISLLKDASATALYGSRGGNGVIIITTKKGTVQGTQLNVNLNQGFSSRGTPEYDRVDAYEYYPLMWQALRNSLVYPTSGTGKTPEEAALQASNTIQSQLIYNPFNVPNNQIVGTDGKLNPNASLLYNDFDWYKPLERTGKRTDANMSVTGKSEKSDYYVSLGYLNDKGYILQSDYRRFNARLSANSTIKSWLKTGFNLAGSTSDGNLASDASTDNANSYINAFMFSRFIGPIYPVRAFDGEGNPIMNELTGEQWYDYGFHPGSINRPQGAYPGRHVIYETQLNEKLNRRNLISGRGYVEIKFLKDFTFRPSISVDIRENHNTTFWNNLVGDGASYNGYSYKLSSTTRSYTFNQIVSYDKVVGKHSINALAGHENYDYDYRSLTATKTGITIEGNSEFPNFVTPYGAGGYRDTYRIESYLSKVAYNYDSRYFFDASLRRDGSSRFAKDSRWGTFFSLGGSWSISKEAFMSNESWIDDLRLKVSYGQVGNDATLNADGDPTYYNYQSLYELGWNNGGQPGVILATQGNPALKWESSNTLNTGVSFSFFNSRIFGELEFYRRGSSNLIFSVPLALSNPIRSVYRNIGSMYNTGIDLQLGGDIIRSKNFTWNMVTNWSTIKNKITKMPAETPVVTSGNKRREVGRDLYNFWLRQYAGVDPADGAALYVPAEGTTTNLRTVNGVEYTTNYNNAKFDYSGSAIPDLIGSINNTFRYKSFALSFLINYQIGGKFYDSNYAGLMGITYGAALHEDIKNSWTTPGQITDIPRIDINSTTQFNAASNRWLIDASYISFRNVNLSYTLPSELTKKFDVSALRVFVTGENLGLISKRKGMNPTESFDGSNNTTYLPSRIFSVGVNVSL
ncbi:MAG: TonB-dependent receptor [Olivibacter sp.]|nr:TonB-dependent receptor [Olivibacter sp. UJ_SKK_5.1]